MIDIKPIYINNIKVNQIPVQRQVEQIINFIMITAISSIFKTKKQMIVNVHSINESKIQKMNLQYRGKDKVTNILTFPCENPNDDDFDFEDMPIELGDIYMCPKTMDKEAKEQGIEPIDHLAHLLVHSCLHLAGYDHEDDESFERMKQREKNILLKMGIKDPYLDI